MTASPAFALLAFALSISACSQTPPPADPPLPTSAPETEAPPASAEPTAAVAPGVKRTDTSIPDDYTISNGDCATLGKRLGELTRSDELAKVSPKLKEKQREKAMQSIDDAAKKIESDWVASCENNLVGKVGDPKSLKCANDAKSVQAFSVCLNGEDPNAKK